MKKGFLDIEIGDTIIVTDEYSRDLEKHLYKVENIEYDDEYATETNPNGMICYGTDLEYWNEELQEYDTNDYIGVVTECSFLGFATLLDFFLKKSSEIENGSYCIDIKENKDISNHYFIQTKVGNCKYVYSEPYGHWNTENIGSDMNLKLQLTAIICDNVTYIVDGYIFGTYHSDFTYPQNVKSFGSFVNECNAYANNTVFQQFYDDLDVSDTLYHEKNCKESARHSIIYNKNYNDHEKYDNILSRQDCANILCGYLDIDKELNNRYQKEIEKIKSFKKNNEMILEYIKNGNVVENWELKLADALRDFDGKFVNVEFEYNGKTASGKLKPEKIMNVLHDKDYFDSYYFDTKTNGEILLSILKASDRIYADNQLRCNHIKKITYGRKELYSA